MDEAPSHESACNNIHGRRRDAWIRLDDGRIRVL